MSRKHLIPPDPGWNITENRSGNYKRTRKTYGGKNIKRYWLNVYNRKLRRFFKGFIRNVKDSSTD